MFNTGYIESELDGTEHVIKEDQFYNYSIPKYYSYQDYMPAIIDQGSRPICVPCSIISYLYWRNSINNIKGNLSIDLIYDSRLDKNANGMQIKTALSFLKHSNNNLYNIISYAILPSPLLMKYSLITNGPFIIALDVMNPNSSGQFWKGSNFEGRHAVSVVGYDDDQNGFIIRNSWGYTYGYNGYYILPYDDFSLIRESWVIIS